MLSLDRGGKEGWSVLEVLLYLTVGILVGILGGLVGIGGGIAVVPILVYGFKMSQHDAQGTSLGMLLPPIGLLAVWTYYKAGHVNLRMAGLLALGFFFGGLLGARLGTALSGPNLRRVFGIFMLLTSLYVIFGPAPRKKDMQTSAPSTEAPAVDMKPAEN